MQSRGNSIDYTAGGNNQYTSTIHYGPFSSSNGHQYQSTAYTLPTGTLSDSFHTYGLYCMLHIQIPLKIQY